MDYQNITYRILTEKDTDMYVDLFNSLRSMMKSDIPKIFKDICVNNLSENHTMVVGAIDNISGNLISSINGHFSPLINTWYCHNHFVRPVDSIAAHSLGWHVFIKKIKLLTDYAESIDYFNFYVRRTVSHQKAYEKVLQQLVKKQVIPELRYNVLYDKFYEAGVSSTHLKNHNFYFNKNLGFGNEEPTMILMHSLKQKHREEIFKKYDYSKKEISKSLTDNIPFLKLKNITVPVNDIINEIKNIDDSEYVSWYPPNIVHYPEIKERHKDYKQLAITTVNPDRSHKNIFETDLFNDWNGGFNYHVSKKWWWTDFALKHLPKTIEFIKTLSDKPISVRIAKTPPNYILGWHNHTNDPLLCYGAANREITHIPLITNPDVYHWVAKDMPNDRRWVNKEELLNSPNVWGQSFKVGEVTIFNDKNPHMLVNYSNEYRYSLLIYNETEDNHTLLNHISDSVKTYTGPFIP